MYLLVTCDVFDDRRRRRVEKILSGYGVRVNLSVFELELPKSKIGSLVASLEKVSSQKDNIRIYFLDEWSLKNSFVLHGSKGVFDAQTLYF